MLDIFLSHDVRDIVVDIISLYLAKPSLPWRAVDYPREILGPGKSCFATGFSDDDCTNPKQRKCLESNIHKMFLLNDHNGYSAPSRFEKFHQMRGGFQC